jgi:transcriptional regulator with XRE-family HTH domain
MTSTLGKRIKEARRALGLSQQALANAISNTGDGIKISRTAIAQWESGVVRGIEGANLLRAAQVLNVRAEWLQFGTGSMRPKTSLSIEQGDVGARLIPLSRSQVASFMGEDNETISYVGLDDLLAKVASEEVFSLVISCNSMVPLLQIGDIGILW